MKILSLMNINVETLSAEEIIEQREAKIKSHFSQTMDEIKSNSPERMKNVKVNWNIFAPPNTMVYNDTYLETCKKALTAYDAAITRSIEDRFYIDQIMQAEKNDNKQKLNNIKKLIVDNINKYREDLFKSLKIDKDTKNADFKNTVEKTLYPKGRAYSVKGPDYPPISKTIQALKDYGAEYSQVNKARDSVKKEVLNLIKEANKIQNDELKSLVIGGIKSLHYLSYELSFIILLGIAAKYYYYEMIANKVATAIGAFAGSTITAAIPL